MPRKLILYLAQSLDGYIAAPDDNLDFLQTVGLWGIHFFYPSQKKHHKIEGSLIEKLMNLIQTTDNSLFDSIFLKNRLFHRENLDSEI